MMPAVCLAMFVFGLAATATATDASAILWSSPGGSAWLTGTNWTGGSVPTGTEIAQFGVNPTSPVNGVGINFNNTTNAGPQIDGQRVEEVGAIELTAVRTANLVIGNSSTTSGASGTLRLNGVTVNGVDNVILRNNSSAALIIQDIQGSGDQTMAVELGNAVDNVINIDSSGPIVITSQIEDGAGSKITLDGAGSGSLTLSGANTFSGGVTVSTGILQLGSNGVVSAGGAIASGPVGTGTLRLSNGTTLRANTVFDRTIQNSLSLSGNIVLGATSDQIGPLMFNSTDGTNTLSTPATVTLTGNTTLTTNVAVTIADAISGAFSLTKAGSSTLTVSGANTYSGGTTLNSGTLRLGSSSTGSVTNGPVGTGTLTLNGGTLASNATDFITVRSIANAIVFDGDVTFGTNTNSGALTFSGNGTLTGNRALTFIADVTYSGNIGESGGSFGMTKNGTGYLKLSGFNSYSGGTTVNAGLLWLNSSGALGSSSGSLTVNGGIVDLAGNGVSVGNLTGSGGTIWNNLGPSSAVTLTIGSGNTGGGDYHGVIMNTNGASPGSTLALTKTGNGTITLSGANTYTGATTINAGTLLINGSTAAGSPVTVNNTGTLGGTGTVGGTVDVKSGGTLSPGTSPGTLHTGAVTLENGSTFLVDLTAALGNDLVVAPSVTLGTIVLGPSLNLNISGSLSIGQQFFIVDNTGANAVSGVFAQGATVTSDSYTFLIDYVANFDTSLAVGGNDIMLEVTAAPEPGTWVGAALAFLVVGYSQRKRFAKRL